MKQTFLNYLNDSGMLSQVKYEIWWSTGMDLDEYLNRTNPLDYTMSFLHPNTREWFTFSEGWLRICFNKYLETIAN